MMNKLYRNVLLAAALLVFVAQTGCSEKSSVVVPKEKPKEAKPSRAMYQADPTIFSLDGTYYLYGTNDESPNLGFQVFTSTNMEAWQGPKGAKNGYALQKTDVFGDTGFWAPQVWKHNGKIYMAYTANEKIAIAQSDSPLGPFSQVTKEPISNAGQIDPFVFIDDDGKKYLFYVRLSSGNKIFVAEMNDDFSGIKSETAKQCIAASEPWENVANAAWSVTEGPTVVKHKGLYYLIYSANDFRHQNYAVGYAVSESVTGPWRKYKKNPVLSIHNTGQAGSGHGDLVKDKNGKLYYVFHTHQSSSQPTPRLTAIAEAAFVKGDGDEDILSINGEKFIHLKSKLP